MINIFYKILNFHLVLKYVQNTFLLCNITTCKLYGVIQIYSINNKVNIRLHIKVKLQQSNISKKN